MNTNNLANLDLARKRAESAKRDMYDMLEAVKRSPEYEFTQKLLFDAQQEIDVLTTAVKVEAEQEYLRTNNKQLDGVTIKILKNYYCTDEAAAKAYAIEKDQTFLQVDMRSLTAEAKKLHGTKYALPFFQEELTISPQIKSDLSEFLPQPETTSAPAAE